MTPDAKEAARIRRVLLRLDGDEERWKSGEPAASGIAEQEVVIALKLIEKERQSLHARLVELSDPTAK